MHECAGDGFTFCLFVKQKIRVVFKSTWRNSIDEGDFAVKHSHVFLVVTCTHSNGTQQWLCLRHFRTSLHSSPPKAMPPPSPHPGRREGGPGRFTRRRPTPPPLRRCKWVSTKKGSWSDPSGLGRPLFHVSFKLSSPSSPCSLSSSLVLEGL